MNKANLHIDTNIEQVLSDFTSSSYNIHQIPVKDGILKITVEDGVPTITYLTDSRVLIESCSTNKIKMYAFKEENNKDGGINE